MNPYNRLRNLVPRPRQGYGTVVALDDAGAWIELPGGAMTRARGTAEVGATVFFTGDVIDGPAPDGLTYTPQEV